jgi:two-component system, NarL family, invasion response regulator UvrY
MKKNILIADDHPIVRSGLIQILNAAPDIVVAGEADDCNDVLAQVQKKNFDLVVLDITMPGGGLEALKQLKTLKTNLPVLMLSVHHEDEYAIRSLKAGASGYLMKTTAQKDLINAIRKILSGGKYISEHLVEQLADYVSGKNDELPHRLLSNREYEIMCMIVAGKGTKEIAQELSLNPKTISTHRGRILVKMKMKNDCDLARYAIENKLMNRCE